MTRASAGSSAQDHAKSGDNWYEYAGNNPVNKTDPTGLSDGLPGSLGAT